MSESKARAAATQPSLTVSRCIRRDAATLFAMWTEPAHLLRWWGPSGVFCVAADVDLRVGGRFRIGNRLPDGEIVWITGLFETIETPRRLVYTWRLDRDDPARGNARCGANDARIERVSVRFDPVAAGTLVQVLHERIPDDVTRASHASGWEGCLEGLARHAVAIDDATS